ncbi:hypothetical protein ABK040_004100 [Willaertia magna]
MFAVFRVPLNKQEKGSISDTESICSSFSSVNGRSVKSEILEVNNIHFPEISTEEIEEETGIIKVFYPYTIKLIKVASGSKHTLFLFSNGNVFCLGSNIYGELGIGYEYEKIEGDNALQNTFFTSSKGTFCENISCGKHHSIFCCKNKDVYGCGSNQQNQLSCVLESSAEINNCYYTPLKLVINSINSSPVCFGEYATMDFQPYFVNICGGNEFGQLGSKTRKTIHGMKMLIDDGICNDRNLKKSYDITLERSNIIQVACTYNASYVIIERKHTNNDTYLDVGKLQNGLISYIFTFENRDHLYGLYCTKNFPIIHCYDKKCNASGVVIPTHKLQYYRKYKGGKTRNIPTSIDKYSFLSFSGIIGSNSVEIQSIITNPYNDCFALVERNNQALRLIRKSEKPKKIMPDDFISNKEVEFNQILLSYSEETIFFYLS